MLTPGPDHPITLEPGRRRWRAEFNNHVIADSNDALILREADLRPVVYFPRADVGMEYMGRTSRQTHCPYKGDACYYTLTMDGEILENVAWSYESPFEGMELIAKRIAFYPGDVKVYEVDDAVVNPPHHDRRDHLDEVQQMVIASDAARAREQAREQARVDDRVDEDASIDEIVQHTDSGSGASQREHWPANVNMPQVGEGGTR